MLGCAEFMSNAVIATLRESFEVIHIAGVPGSGGAEDPELDSGIMGFF